MAIIGGQNNKYVFFHRICLKVEEKTGKNWASSNIYTFCKGGQVPKINEKQFELARNSSYGVNFTEINKVKGREI